MEYIEDTVVKTRSIEQIVIMPRPTVGAEISILIAEKQGVTTAWQRKSVASAGLSFAFVGLFQWDTYGFLNLPMVRCKIRACAGHPEYLEKDALIDIEKVGFFLADAKPD
jgi:hypothetical protein